MTRRFLSALLVFLLFPGFALSGLEPTQPLKVLFLGDQGHHQPARLAAQLVPVMAGRGIEIIYTEDLTALNLQNLFHFDALLLYANIERIEPAQEQALLDYVASGRGFVPVHCASYCFLNSPAFIQLVGAQFLKHGTGEFDTRVVDPAHPAMNGLEPFRTWDETYTHHKATADRHILQVREEQGQEPEPWTWTRTHGKGRVFYTAYGHDERTWTHPGFHDLIERGLRWAANKGDVYDSRPRVSPDAPAFSYKETEHPIPNYVESTRHGTQAEPFKSLQEPLPPEASQKHLALPPGFHPELFAAEPQIFKPLCMAWDEQGRLWIAESVDYPNDPRRTEKGNDRISILEDTDADGQADKFQVFADGLSIPTSIAFSRGGVIVHQAPDTLFLKDTDGDNRADQRSVLFTGWGTRDTHAGPSNLRYGLDNQLHGIVGYSAFDGEVGGERHRFSQGFYRFKPDGSSLEFLRSTSNNSWGLGFTEEGLTFGSTANGCASVFLPIPNRYYEQVRGASPTVLKPIIDSNRFFPITDRVRQVDWFGGFTAAAGHAVYTARTYPPHYWNATAFVAEPTGHLLATLTLERKGADFATHYGWNQLASDDEWTAPIMAEVGPDGNVWVIDWYNYIVQHNPTPQGFETGPGNAYETPLRDKTHGRIYRLIHESGRPQPSPKLDPARPDSLVPALAHTNMFWRLHAQRLLVERGQRDVVPALVALVQDQSVDAIGLNPGAIHALWTLHGLGAFDQKDGSPEAQAAAIKALAHPSAGVRLNSLRVLSADARAGEADTTTTAVLPLLQDADPQVRLAALLALADLPESAPAAQALVAALQSGNLVADDPWLADAATAAAASHAAPFLKALAEASFDQKPAAALASLAERVAEHLARSGASAAPIERLVVSLASADPAIASPVITGLERGWPSEQALPVDRAAIEKLLERLPAPNRGPLLSLARRWKVEGLDAYVAALATALLETASSETTSEAARLEAARELVALRSDDLQAVADLLALLGPRTSPTLAAGLIAATAQSQAKSASQSLVAAYPALTPAVRIEILRALLSRPDGPATLIDGIEAATIPLGQLALDQKQALAAHPDASLATRARKLLSQGGGLPDANRQKVIDELSPLLLTGGDPAAGKPVFEQLCAKCHMYGGEGGKVGPDLTGMAAHPREELLVHIFDPSRSVEGNYTQYTVATADGRVLNGLLASETRTSIELIDAEGKSQPLLRDDVEELVASDKSLMPEGFEKQATPEQLAHLMAFLTRPGKYLPLDLRKVATVVSTRGMFNDENSTVERLVFDDYSPKTVEGVPFLLVDPEGARVPNAILLNSRNGTLPPRMPRSVELPCNVRAKAIHMLGGVGGWAYPGGLEGSPSLLVRLHYADGATEDHPLQNGVHLADYIRRVEVPGSKLAFDLRGRQVRYLAIEPKRQDQTIARIELIKGRDDVAPLVLALTVEVAQ